MKHIAYAPFILPASKSNLYNDLIHLSRGMVRLLSTHMTNLVSASKVIIKVKPMSEELLIVLAGAPL